MHERVVRPGAQQSAYRRVGHADLGDRRDDFAHDDAAVAAGARETGREMDPFGGAGLDLHARHGEVGADHARHVQPRAAFVEELSHRVGEVVGGGSPQIEIVEAIGSDIYLNFSHAGTPMTARVEATVNIKVGQEVALYPDPERIHLFDPQSGVTLL